MTWACGIHGEFKAEELSQDDVGSQGKVRCPDGGRIMTNQGDEDLDQIPEVEDKAVEEGDGDTSRTKSKRQVELEAEDMMLAKRMIEAGLGKDLNTVTKRALRYYGGTNFNGVIHEDDSTMMNEQLLEALQGGNGESMVEKAMAFSMLNGSMGATQQTQEEDSMDSMTMMMLLQQMGNNGNSSQPPQNQGNQMDPMTMMMLMQNMGSSNGSDGLSKDELLSLVKEMKDGSSDGMDPMMMMAMQNDDSNQDDAYKELLQRFDSQRQQQQQMQEKLLEERFGNELDNMKQQLQGIAKETQEAKQSDMQELLTQMEDVEKFARKLGMTETGGEDSGDTAQTMERLIDTVGEHMGPALEKYAEQQAGGGTSQRAVQQMQNNQGSTQQRQQEVQQARAEAEQPSPNEVQF